MKFLNFSEANFTSIWKAALLLPVLALFIACSNEDDSFARVTVNGTQLTTSPSDFTVGDRSDFNGDVDASFTGNGGTTARIFSWNNNLTTADYNADVTLATGGSFQMIVEDSEGMVVLDETLQGAREPDSIDGVTAAGTSGIWTVTIRVTNFEGDGSFSLSEGN
jgi:hypothetical protein